MRVDLLLLRRCWSISIQNAFWVSKNRSEGGDTIATQEKIIDVINDYARYRDGGMLRIDETD